VSKATPRKIWRHLLPWVVSAGALFYVFGHIVDWRAIPNASGDANLPLFITITVFDKLVFFVFWGVVQAGVIRRFVEPVPVRDIIEIKGGAELLRAASNVVSDAAFFYGVSQLVVDKLSAFIAVITIPFGAHFFVLLIQASLSMLLLEGSAGDNWGVSTFIVSGWAIVAGIVLSARFGLWERLAQRSGMAALASTMKLRDLAPFVGWFAAFAVFDVFIQWFASRSFGVDIPWREIAARLPILYLAISIPSFGNFGTREIAWSTLFEGHGPREALIAFALWTNAIFAAMHVLIGGLFFGRALSLVRGLRTARREGEEMPEPLLRDAADP